MKVQRVRAVIFYDNGIILIKRIKIKNNIKKLYYVFPGGGIENGETINETAIREVKEELGIDINPINQLYRLESNDNSQIFVLCKYIDGIIGTGQGEEYTQRNSKDNQYIPEIIPINKIKELDLLEEVKIALLKDINNNCNLETKKLEELIYIK
jgi:mutator protein MutT